MQELCESLAKVVEELPGVRFMLKPHDGVIGAAIGDSVVVHVHLGINGSIQLTPARGLPAWSLLATPAWSSVPRTREARTADRRSVSCGKVEGQVRSPYRRAEYAPPAGRRSYS